MFLLKPHVTGPEGQVTTPDIVVDRLVVDGKRRSLGFLTHDCWQEVGADVSFRPAYALMALGGGALILPAQVLSSGMVIAARAAWRLNNLDGHVGEVTLNGIPLSDLELPSDLVAAAGGAGDALPRGFMLARTLEAAATEVILADPALDRELSLTVHFQSLDADRWGDARPRPRYSVGPTQKEVSHFI
ncbi:MAG: hypothetical protein F4Y60_11995 [Boseongicola sp. SB0664_bin_43]|uniref:Uncharacterized protein n=1 Tax=Boseongicola sp. SB0664_bin_43 TaxID=2604844 RepID=A0A6B0Y181_9RHOB|nr:hypothetical protein [Boseongicola sp. SB0664_bin_43]